MQISPVKMTNKGLEHFRSPKRLKHPTCQHVRCWLEKMLGCWKVPENSCMASSFQCLGTLFNRFSNSCAVHVKITLFSVSFQRCLGGKCATAKTGCSHFHLPTHDIFSQMCWNQLYLQGSLPIWKHKYIYISTVIFILKIRHMRTIKYSCDIPPLIRHWLNFE